MFGIAWGVGSLLLLVGLGEGFRAGNRKQFEELGENLIFLFGAGPPLWKAASTACDSTT
jgi:putative ABC transport system permease protein